MPSSGQGHAGCDGIAEWTARTEEPAAISRVTPARQRDRDRLTRETSGPAVTTRRVKRPETRLRPIRKASIPAEVTLPNWRHPGMTSLGPPFHLSSGGFVEAAKPCRGLCPVVNSQLPNDVVQVDFDGMLGQSTLGSNQLVLETVRNHSEYLRFAGG